MLYTKRLNSENKYEYPKLFNKINDLDVVRKFT